MIRLNISQQYSKLELSIQKPLLSLRTTQPQIQISTQASKLEISSGRGRLQIDQTPCRASCGIKNNTEFTRDFSLAGKQAALEAIGNIAQEGDRMAAVESGEDAIVNIAAEKNYPEPLDITYAQIASPIIRYVPDPPNFNYTPSKVGVKLHQGTVASNLNRGKVDVRIAQYNSIRFWTTGNKADMSI